jgi:hypothetical protein
MTFNGTTPTTLPEEVTWFGTESETALRVLPVSMAPNKGYPEYMRLPVSVAISPVVVFVMETLVT